MADQEHDDRWLPLSKMIGSAPAETTVCVSVRHLRSGATFAHLGDRLVPAASTIKLLILIAVARAIDAAAIDLSARIVPATQTRVPGSGVLNWLSRDLAPTVADHAWLMTAISDNTASNVLIDVVGFPAIADVQRDLDLPQTKLSRYFMSTSRHPEGPPNSVSAADLTSMLEAIGTDRASSPAGCAWMRSVLGDQQYRDGIGRHLPSGVYYAGKTGWQTGIVHDCGLLTGPGGTVAVAVLTEGYAEPYSAHALMGAIGEVAARAIV